MATLIEREDVPQIAQPASGAVPLAAAATKPMQEHGRWPNATEVDTAQTHAIDVKIATCRPAHVVDLPESSQDRWLSAFRSSGSDYESCAPLAYL
jgi:hypothetical protein